MPSRSGVVFSFGQQAGFAMFEQLPKGCIGWNQLRANVGPIGGTETVVLSVPNVTVYTNRLVIVEFDGMASSDDGASYIGLKLYQGVTEIARSEYLLDPVANEEQGCSIAGWATGGSGSFTFSLSAFRAHGAGNVTMEAGALYPGLLRITDVGPAF